MLRLAKFGLIFQHVARIVIFSEKLYENHILRLNAILPKLDVAIIYVSVQQARKVKYSYVVLRTAHTPPT